MKKLVECVPNISEGNDQSIINEIVDSVKNYPGIKLLNVDPGKATNRTVITFVGESEIIVDAAFNLIEKAKELIDMSNHSGEHPRMGAVDVCPLIPISGITMEETVILAHQLSERVGNELSIPVYCYEYAAKEEKRKNLANCRAGEYEGLEKKLNDKLMQALDFYNSVFEHSFGASKIDLNELVDLNLKQAEQLKPYVGNVIEEIRGLQKSKKKILYEGAQGALLDVSLGTYPYVTSSNLIGGVPAGVGISPSDIDYTIGITKAYTTRVGEGPFPTELFDEMGTYLAETGGEVGATTGRPRRCGWLDGFLLKNMVKVSGVDGLCLTKIDVLDDLEKIKICTEYSSELTEAEMIETMDLELAKPEYLEMPGWSKPTAGQTSYTELDDNAKSFVEKIEEISGVPVIMISTGPKREDTIIRKDI